VVDPSFPRTLETPRLSLRAYGEQDAAALMALVDADREALRRDFHATVDRLTTLDAAGEYIREAAAERESRRTFIYGIWTRQAPALIGQIKVKNIAWEIPGAEVSYFIGPAFRRQAYASEALLAVLRAAFGVLQFNRIYARVVSSNQESLALSRKLGMRHEGLHRNEFRCGYGELRDVDYFSITGAEYPGILSKHRHILEP